MKKLLGALVIAGVVGTAIVLRKTWTPLLKAGIQESLIWALEIEGPSDDVFLEEMETQG